MSLHNRNEPFFRLPVFQQSPHHALIPKVRLPRLNLDAALHFLERQGEIPFKGEIKAKIEDFLGKGKCYCFHGVDDFQCPIGDYSTVLQIIDSGDLINPNMRGRKRRLQIHILDVHQKIISLNLHQTKYQTGELDRIFTRKFIQFVDI